MDTPLSRKLRTARIGAGHCTKPSTVHRLSRNAQSSVRLRGLASSPVRLPRYRGLCRCATTNPSTSSGLALPLGRNAHAERRFANQREVPGAKPCYLGQVIEKLFEWRTKLIFWFPLDGGVVQLRRGYGSIPGRSNT